jgi:SpoIID/LytB domain protein
MYKTNKSLSLSSLLSSLPSLLSAISSRPNSFLFLFLLLFSAAAAVIVIISPHKAWCVEDKSAIKNDFIFPPNENIVKLPLKNIDICLIDNYKTAEIMIKGDFDISAAGGADGDNFKAAGRSLSLKITGISKSKPAVIKHYAVLKTFPYSHIHRGDKIKGAHETIGGLNKDFGPLSFFTYGCILSAAHGGRDIDVRTLFAAAGPFGDEKECREFCDRMRANHNIAAFAHCVREKKPECLFNAVIEYAENKNKDDKTPPGGAPLKSIKLNDIKEVRLSAAGEILIKNMEFGRGDKWHNFKDARYAAAIKISGDNHGLLHIINTIGFDELLKVVVPSEIEADSAYQAVCAQAVAARSEVLAKFKTRHTESDYDFCASTHCQAYGGINNKRNSTDRAVDETSGMIMFSNGHIVDTVYHANCGGLTEDSNKIWSAPFDAALVKINDSTLETDFDFSTDETALKNFILNPPPSYCSVPGACNNPDKYRWKREFGASEIDNMIKKQYEIGPIKKIKVSRRGSSGRAIALELTGARETVTVYKELPIRKLFGMLRSSLFIVETVPGGPKGAEARYIFRGAGWGHGVGMCQDGAKGMAITGKDFKQILLHYYSKSKILDFK